MKLFVDSADPAEIGACVAAAGTAGVTTSAAALVGAARAAGGTAVELLRAVCGVAAGPVSVAIALGGADRAELLREARAWSAVAPNVIVKLPAGDAGLEVVRACAAERIATATEAGPRLEQAVAAARAGAAYLTAPMGRADGVDGNDAIRKLAALLRTYDVATQIVVTGIRIPTDVIDAALIGAHAVAAAAAVLRQLPAESTRLADAGRG